MIKARCCADGGGGFLAAQGRQPARTIILAFGHDEEIGGANGAVLMSQALVDRGQRAWFVLDEGSAAIDPHPLTGAPAAIIAVAERGFATLRVHAAGQPGHSSTPPHETAVSLAAEAVDRIHAMPITRSLEGGPAIDMMRALAPEISFTTRMAVANEGCPLLRGGMAIRSPGVAHRCAHHDQWRRAAQRAAGGGGSDDQFSSAST